MTDTKDCSEGAPVVGPSRLNQQGSSANGRTDAQDGNFTCTLMNALLQKNHVVHFDIPAVKILGITIRKSYQATKFVKCECGESAKERMVKSLYQESPLWKELMEKAHAKK